LAAYGYTSGEFRLNAPLDLLLAFALGGTFHWVVSALFQWTQDADAWIGLALKQARLTNWQIIMLGIALEQDQPWLHLQLDARRVLRISVKPHTGFLKRISRIWTWGPFASIARIGIG
jgi:hypothetical protein